MTEEGSEEGIIACARQMASFLLSAARVEVVSHIDADGITAAAIAKTALDRAGVPNHVHFLKKLDERSIHRIDDCEKVVWLTDLGSGYADKLQGRIAGLCITDHHAPSLPLPSMPLSVAGKQLKRRAGRRKVCTVHESQRSIESCLGRVYHLNPHLFGGGSSSLSGAGAAYLVARAMDQRNEDLAALAVVGAIGDFQDQDTGRLRSFNRLIVDDAVGKEMVRVEVDLRAYGRESRPLAKYLENCSDPRIPGVTNNPAGCAEVLREAGVEAKEKGGWRAWASLEAAERRAIISALVERMLDASAEEKEIKRLVGECYCLCQEEEAVLRDAKEYSTLLNSCGRYNKAKMGMQVCIGDRDEEWRKSLQQLRSHRDNMKGAMDFVRRNGIERNEYRHLQYIRGSLNCLEAKVDVQLVKDPHGCLSRSMSFSMLRDPNGFCLPVEETVVGILAGMTLSSELTTDDRPIVAFAAALDANGDMKTKASARGTRALVERGLDLSKAMKEAAEACGGTGGGHNIAAGATIPEGREEEFLSRLDGIFAASVRN